MGDHNRPKPAIEKQIPTSRHILQRAKGLLTSTGIPTLAAQEALQIIPADPSPDRGMALHANLDDGNGRLRDSMISFLKAKTAPMVKSIRSRSQDARRNRKDDHSDSCPPPISMTTTPSAVSSSEEQPTATTLVVPNLPGTTISDIAPPTQRITEKSSMADGTVPLLLREGVKMTKISPGKQRSYIFKLDPDQGQIIWQSKKLRISTYFDQRYPLGC